MKMTSKTKQSQEPFRLALAALNRFEQAVRDHAFMGAQHPDNQAEIEDRYLSSRRELIRWLRKQQ